MKRIKAASLVSCLFAILICAACAKIDTTDIGNGLIPAIDNINTFDTTLEVFTDNKLFNDTTRMIQSDHGVGIIENDLEFGKTVATTYASFTPGSYKIYPFGKRDSLVIDSVVLSLAYTSTFGDSTATEQFEVREIENRLGNFPDSLYYLHAPDIQVRPDLLGTATVNFARLRDSVMYRNGRDTITKGNELRIKLDTLWARHFANYDTSATSAYNNDSIFKRNFGGLEIRPVEGQGTRNAIGYFNLANNESTRITFYCRVQNNGKTDTISPFFTYTSDPQANIIRRTPANGYQANVTNITDNDEKLYIQSTPGSYASVKIPGLTGMSNRVIHKAELIFEEYPNIDPVYRTPAILFIDAISTTGDSSFTIRNDFVPVNTTLGYDLNSLGGISRNKQYVFNLARYIQSLVTKQYINYTLKVYAPFTTQPYYMPGNTDQATGKLGIIINTPVAAGRVILYGGGSTDTKKARLRIIYSRI